MDRAIHTFDNGVRVYDDHLLPVQRERYARRNVHEAEEEDVFVALIRGLPSDGRFVNIGSAVGYYILLAKRLAPGLRLHAVEPLARHRTYLIENARLNELAADAITLHPEAVAAAEGTAELHDEHYGSMLVRGTASPPRGLLARLLRRSRAPVATDRTVVTTITLDAMLERIGGRADLVQMDVQGFEADVLRGSLRALRNRSVGAFLIGTHGAAVHGECRELLMSHRYAIELSHPDATDQPDGILVASSTGNALIRGRKAA